MRVTGSNTVAGNSATAFAAQGQAVADTGQDGVLSLPRAVAQDMCAFDEALSSAHSGGLSHTGVNLGVGLAALLSHMR